MVAQWIGDLIGKMHVYGVTAKELSAYMGYNPKYVSAVLNGKRSPRKAEETFSAALEGLILERKTAGDTQQAEGR